MENNVEEKDNKNVAAALKNCGRYFISSVDTEPRIQLFFYAIIIQLLGLTISGFGYYISANPFWLIGSFIYIVWFLMMFAILHPQTGNYLKSKNISLKRGTISIIVIMCIVIIGEIVLLALPVANSDSNAEKGTLEEMILSLQNAFTYTDSTALTVQAVENLLEGKNPYAHSNIVSALVKYKGSYSQTTPLRVGRLADTFPYPTDEQLAKIWQSALADTSQIPEELDTVMCYPAGSFLFLTPFYALGINNSMLIYGLIVIAAITYTTLQLPRDKRLIFIIAAIISMDIWNCIFNSSISNMVFPFLLIAWVTLDKKKAVSPIAMGIAAAAKQTAWFFIPFYLILDWKTHGLKSALKSTAIIGLVFFAVNGYFIFQDPQLWFDSVIYPMTEPAFPEGVGIITWVTSGLFNIQSQLLFAVLEVAVFVGAAIWYIRNAKKYPDAGPLLAVVPLFFAWRSLSSYFFYITIIVLACVLYRTKQKEEPRFKALQT
jgi:hypothetical protein